MHIKVHTSESPVQVVVVQPTYLVLHRLLEYHSCTNLKIHSSVFGFGSLTLKNCYNKSEFSQEKNMRSQFLQINFQLLVKNNLGFLWFHLMSLHDQSRKVMPLSRPSRSKTKTNRDYLLGHLCFRALQAGSLLFTLSSNLLLVILISCHDCLLWFFWVYTTLDQKVP